MDRSKKKSKCEHYLGNSPRIVLAVIGGAIKSSSIMSSVSSSPVNDEEDFVGDYEVIQKMKYGY